MSEASNYQFVFCSLFFSNDLILVEQNAAAEKLFKGKSIGKHFNELFHSQDIEKDTVGVHAAIKNNKVAEIVLGVKFPEPIEYKLYAYVLNENGMIRLAGLVPSKLIYENHNQIDAGKKNTNETELLTYMVAHELQEPLNTIKGYLLLIEENLATLSASEIAEYIKQPIESVKQMKELVSEMLQYSKTGKNNGKAELVSLNNIVNDVIGNLKERIKNTSSSVTVETLPEITANAVEMKILFQNLISNAIKFNNKGIKPVINISAEVVNNYWILKVKDNGIGISEANAGKIFTLFHRVHNKEQFEGTGIGLAHCRKIVEAHNGKIWVESVEGEGCIFYIKLPANTEKQPRLNCILLVDDNDLTNIFNKRFLERTRIAKNIFTVKNGQQALDYLSHQDKYADIEKYPDPDLILLDINMPVLTGWEFLEEFKKFDEKLKKQKVIILTTSPSPEDEEKARGILEVSDYKVKPLTKEILEDIISTHFDNLN
jgi:signal transduction histidine kinase